TALARAPARRRPSQRRARLPVLRVLGERELDAALGRSRRRQPRRAAVFARSRPSPCGGPRATLPRSALHPRARSTSVHRLSRGFAARPAWLRRALSRAGEARWNRRSVSRIHPAAGLALTGGV